MALTVYRVKFINSEPDFETTELGPDAICDDIMCQIRDYKMLPHYTVIRLICCGRELYPEDPVDRATSNVVHCIVSDGAPPERTEYPVRTVDPPPPDWLDMINLGAVLMWLFCTILTILWFGFVIYPFLYDRTSFLILCMMTVSHFIPNLLWLLLPPPAAPGMMMYDPAMARSNILHTGPGLHGPIPPRPAARIPPGGSC